MIKLYHRKNEIAVDLSGVNNPRAITIVYVGKFHGESMLPDDWQFFANRSKITCLSFSQNSSIPELLFNYTGLIHIKGGTVIDADLEKHSFHVSLEDIDYWETSTGKFSTNTQYWDGLDSTHDRGGDISRTAMVKKNLKMGHLTMENIINIKIHKRCQGQSIQRNQNLYIEKVGME